MFKILIIAGLIHSFLSSQISAQTSEIAGPDDMLLVQPLKPLTPEMKEIERDFDAEIVPRLYGGHPVAEGELSPSVYIGNCTATILGPSVLLTAGHCRATGDAIAFTVGKTRYSGSCRRHEKWNNGIWMNNDFTLCTFLPEISLTYYGDLSKVSLNPGDKVTMQGYGAGSNGHLNQGTAVVLSGDDMEYITKGSVALGGGDSGGGLMAKIDNLVSGPFKVVGINSRGGGGYSYFNRTDLDRSQAFFADFASKNNVKICGINWNCSAVGRQCPEELAIYNYFVTELAFWKKNLDTCQSGPAKKKMGIFSR